MWVRGVVQGVGFRPYVYALARRHGVDGWVRNTSAGVEILAEGAGADVDRFAAALPQEAPPRSRITSCETSPAAPESAGGFAILESVADPAAYQLVPPDIATCAACRVELLDPADRRHGYPFTNCTDCGPRFTIIEDLPYDRERTTMRHFPLCPACRREYEDPEARRFHAEPNACPVCGPRVRLLRREPAAAGRGGVDDSFETVAVGTADDPAAPIGTAAELLRAGEILAVKGLGGYHLACDATVGDVVRRLKARKRRPHKPLAVMFPGIDELRKHCRVSAREEELLTSPEHPIVLLEWRRDGPVAPVDPEVAPGQRRLGAMLPYTPLHILLLRAAQRPLVMTSGNLAEEPIVKEWAEIGRLAPVADAYLEHDRGIAARCDDSVAVVQGDRPRLLRRARGYAPLPVPLPRQLPQTLGCGAELKNAFCLTREADAFLSQHIGDLENLETLEHYEASIARYQRLFGVSPEVIGYDLHPEYLATKYARALPQHEKVAVQHHHAHVAARLVECGRESPAIGVSMDGLGYGDDGRLWGGEVLVCDLAGYRRVAHLEELPLPGGAAAIGRPWRTAAGWAYVLLGQDGSRAGGAAAARAGRRGRTSPERRRAGGPAGPGRPCAERAAHDQLRTPLRRRQRSGGRPAQGHVRGPGGDRAGDAVGGPIVSCSGAVSVRRGRRPRGRGHRAAGWEPPGGSPPTLRAPPISTRQPAVVRLAPLLAGVLDDLEAGA